MRYQRLGELGNEFPVVHHEGKIWNLQPVFADLDEKFFGLGFEAANRIVREALETGALSEVEDAADLRVGAPIARPQAVVCIGQNYAAHAAESGDAAPTMPIIFFKHPNTVVGPYDEVRIPFGAEKVDWEVELGVVVGRQARYATSPEQALQSVFGYVTSHDVSERAFQIDQSGGQWSKGKCAETFNPVGPELVTADEVDPQDLNLWSRVNGEARQDSNTSDMIFSVADIVYDLSQYMVLEPGDLINTGTPQGVALSGKFPYVQVGDEVEICVEGLGSPQKQVFVEAQ
jgi:2-keto-4-pentenoate hydratase/2-oxohepta-3-ene-1,7-dioic acid hydratase in catechol pathway